MIVKKVKNPRKSASKAVRVRGLSDYIVAPEREGSDEKCVYAGARGFLSADLQSQQAEMLALSQEAVRSQDTINHYVLSWREGEQPTPGQVEEAIDIFLDELGLQEHQAIYGLHADTDNLHLHLAVNRVHPETLKVIKPNQGFDIEAAHRAIARIEHAQGWQREHHGRYRVSDQGLDKGGELELDRVPRDPDRVRQPASPKRDMEQRTGEKSAERIAMEDGAPVIRRASSWQQLHRELGAQGMRYEKTGSGATVWVGEVRIKASSADRGASLARLQERLGPYEPAPERQLVASRVPEPVQAGVEGWDTYIAGRQAHHADKSAARGAFEKDRSRRQESERRQLAERQDKRRAELLQGGWQGRGELREALQSILAAEQAAEKAELAERQLLERRQERDRVRQRFGAYPDLEQWQRQQGRVGQAERWRYRASEPQWIEGQGNHLAMPRDIRGFVGEAIGREVHYRRRVEPLQTSKEAGQPRGTEVLRTAATEPEVAFIDRGPRIEVVDWQDRDTTLAALQLGAQKFGRMEVLGNDNYKAMCASLAAEHGFEVTNPELQERIRQLREEMGRGRAKQEREEPIQRVPAPLLRVKALPVNRALAREALPAMPAPVAGSALDSYQRHYREVSGEKGQQQDSAIDTSRLDALVAVRMRVTGHTQGEIEEALRQVAAARAGRDLDDYAKRTARYAFSRVGEQKASQAAQFRPQWRRLEGRDLPQVPNVPEKEPPERLRTIERPQPTKGRSR